MNKLILGATFLAAACTGEIAGDDPGSGSGTVEPGGVCETSSDCSVAAPVCDNGVCAASCAGNEIGADFGTAPSDIIWIVDQSGSMDQETAYVQSKINDFVALIGASNIDYRVVMIAAPNAENAICVPGPLAGPNCGDNTRFRLVDQEVDSNDGPQLVLSTYPKYADFLRPDAAKHLVFVTDDDSDLSAAAFTNGLQGLQPAGMFGNFKVHGIYAYGSGPNGCTGAFGAGAADGTVYTSLIAQTGGAAGVICTGDWTTVFQDITKAVVSGSQLSCELALPAPPAGETIDPNKAAVIYESAAAPGLTLPRVSTSADCDAAGGWYFDDNANPTKILLCPATCSTVQNDPGAKVRVELGCSTPIL